MKIVSEMVVVMKVLEKVKSKFQRVQRTKRTFQEQKYGKKSMKFSGKFISLANGNWKEE